MQAAAARWFPHSSGPPLLLLSLPSSASPQQLRRLLRRRFFPSLSVLLLSSAAPYSTPCLSSSSSCENPALGAANCCAINPRSTSNFPFLSSHSRSCRQTFSASRPQKKQDIKLISQALGTLPFNKAESFPLFFGSSTGSLFSPSIPKPNGGLVQVQIRTLACSSFLTKQVTAAAASSSSTTTPRSSPTSRSGALLEFLRFGSQYITNRIPKTFYKPNSSFTKYRHFHNRYHSTRQHSHPSNRKRLVVYAGTSVFLALIGIYTVTESDPSSPALFELPKPLAALTSRSLYDWWSASPETSAAPSSAPPSAPQNPIIPNNMTTTLQGRPETLTPEQEAKLKEFWNATLKLFGQSATDIENEIAAVEEEAASTNANDQDGSIDRTDSEVSLKKKRKFFSRSKKDKKDKDIKDKEKDSAPSSGATTPSLGGDPEDKYNQGKDFKAALASQTPEQLRSTFWGFVKYDNPDGLLLRFLRARKWDVDKALVMMVSTMHWRGQEVLVEEIVKDGELHAVENGNDGFMKQLRIGKSYIHGVDKEDRPVCIVSARLHRAGDQTEESLERYTVYLIETTRMLLKPPVDTACILFDMTGFGLANMDYAPVKFMIKCFEAHYPECLGVCLVHKAPWVFQGIWKIIRGWLDPVVASKVHFTSDVNDLAKFINKSQIPKFLEGDEDWEYEYVEPVPGENPFLDSTKPEDLEEKQLLTEERWRIIEEYEQNTRDWIKEESKGATVNTPVKDERSGLRERLKINYWGLDKYLRAQTYYDRIGMIGKNGEVDFYPAKKGEKEEEKKVNGNGTAEVPAHTSDEDLD
ncbi:Patellin-5 [Dactylella cylindrospora]|nr:Patellin-5 [Dactylella cylindrospora]